MAPKFPKALPFFQQIRSTWVSPWPFWGLFPWLLLWCVSARGGPEFLEVRHHYVASCAINYPCVIEKIHEPALQKEFENQRTQSLGSTFPIRGRGKIYPFIHHTGWYAHIIFLILRNPFPNHFDTPCSSFRCLRLLLLLVLLESLAPSWSFWFFISCDIKDVLDVLWRNEVKS